MRWDEERRRQRHCILVRRPDGVHSRHHQAGRRGALPQPCRRRGLCSWGSSFAVSVATANYCHAAASDFAFSFDIAPASTLTPDATTATISTAPPAAGWQLRWVVRD